MKKKLCVVTGTRADYGLFYPLINRIKRDELFDLQIIAAGMHLSPEFGYTYKEIEKDGFRIDEKVDMDLSSDTEAGISKSIATGIAGFANVFSRSRPDMLLLLGDRFETFAAAISAFIARIPIAHLHGGELTEGAIDDSFRHAITKMSFFHFTSADEYRHRVIQLGEAPDRVFNVGALGIDNIKETKLLSKNELEKDLGFKFGKLTAIVTYHPVTLENNTSKVQFNELLGALDNIPDLNIIFTKPNADTDGRVIIKLIDDHVSRNPERAAAFTSLGRLRYLSALNSADLVIGNSSSGIIEAPSLGRPTVNIGDRQRGRIRAESVIDCRPEKESIGAAIEKALSDEFRKLSAGVKNPYGDGNTSEKILDILKIKLQESIEIKKGFFDLKNISFE